jgi:hypothetical protein
MNSFRCSPTNSEEGGWPAAKRCGQRVRVGLYRRRSIAGKSGADAGDVLGHGVIYPSDCQGHFGAGCFRRRINGKRVAAAD